MERDSPVKPNRQQEYIEEASPRKTKEPKLKASAPMSFLNISTIGLLQTLKFQEQIGSEYLVTVSSQYEAKNISNFGDVPTMTLQLNNDFSGKLVNYTDSSNPPQTIYLATNTQSSLIEFVGFDNTQPYNYEIDYQSFMNTPNANYKWKSTTSGSFVINPFMSIFATKILSE